jgi:hypothetical protein
MRMRPLVVAAMCLVGVASSRCSDTAGSTPDGGSGAGGGPSDGGTADAGGGGGVDAGGGSDAGGGGDGGASDGGGGGGGGGGTDGGGGGGTACTQPGPASVEPRRYVIGPAGREPNYTSGDATGTMLFGVNGPAIRNPNEGALVAADGTEKRYLVFVRGATLHADQSGFSGMFGGFSTSWSFRHIDANGDETGSVSYNVSNRNNATPPLQFADPRDGTLLAGEFRRTSEPESAASRRAVFLRGSGPSEIWTAPLAGSGGVFGAGLDLASNALVIMDGSARWGSGAISAQWFSSTGAKLTDEFLLISGFQPGASTWFEVSALSGGGVAVRRVDATDSSGKVRSSRYLCVVGVGETSCGAMPQWLASLRDQRIEPIRNGAAYALLPDQTAASDCTQHVELLDANGTSCGGADLPMAQGSCTTQPLSVGREGTLIQPQAEKAWDCSDSQRGCRPVWRWWPGMFR